MEESYKIFSIGLESISRSRHDFIFSITTFENPLDRGTQILTEISPWRYVCTNNSNLHTINESMKTPV